MRSVIKSIYWILRGRFPFKYVFRIVWDPLKTKVNIVRYAGQEVRNLEIGCSGGRMPGFETLSIVGGPRIDYVLDASKPLPFPDATFDLIYASHVLEHVPWYLLEASLKEWLRVLKCNGKLEVWTPNGLAVCRSVCAAEDNTPNDAMELDGWFTFNEGKNPYIWANGRIFSYGDGTGAAVSPNWHRSILTPRYLKSLFAESGFHDVCEMNRAEVRAADHGWINLGVKGRKA